MYIASISERCREPGTQFHQKLGLPALCFGRTKAKLYPPAPIPESCMNAQKMYTRSVCSNRLRCVSSGIEFGFDLELVFCSN